MTLDQKFALASLIATIIFGAISALISRAFRLWVAKHPRDLLIFILLCALAYKQWHVMPAPAPAPIPPKPVPGWVDQESLSNAQNDFRGEFYLTETDPTDQIQKEIRPFGHTVKSGSNSKVPLYAGTGPGNLGKITTHGKEYLGGGVKPVGFTLKIDPTPPSGQKLWVLTGGDLPVCKSILGMVSSSSGQDGCTNDFIGYLAP